jgi:hypothetical protein
VLAAELARGDATDRVAPRRAARVAVFAIGVLALLVPAVVVWCGDALAPFLWSSRADRHCQAAGFWYATSEDLGPSTSCEKWTTKGTRR